MTSSNVHVCQCGAGSYRIGRHRRHNLYPWILHTNSFKARNSFSVRLYLNVIIRVWRLYARKPPTVFYLFNETFFFIDRHLTIISYMLVVTSRFRCHDTQQRNVVASWRCITLYPLFILFILVPRHVERSLEGNGFTFRGGRGVGGNSGQSCISSFLKRGSTLKDRKEKALVPFVPFLSRTSFQKDSFCLTSEKRSILKRKNLLPFKKGYQENKQKITKIVFLVKPKQKIYQRYPLP